MSLYIKANDGRYVDVFNTNEFTRFLKEFGAITCDDVQFFFSLFKFCMMNDYMYEGKGAYELVKFIESNIDDVYFRYGNADDYVEAVLCDYERDFDIYKCTQLGNIFADILNDHIPQDVEIGAYEFCKKYYPDIVK